MDLIESKWTKCVFGIDKSCQFILLFNLFLLLLIDSTALFGIIYESHCTISVNLYFYLHRFLHVKIPKRKDLKSAGLGCLVNH